MGFIVKAVKSVVKAVVGVVSKVVGGVFGFIVGKSAKKAKAASTLNKSLEPETGRKIVFGHTAAPLDVRYWEVYGPSAKLFDEVVAVATHRIHSFGELYCEDDIAITNAGQVVGNFAGILSRDTRLGAKNQTGMFVGSGTQWNANSTFDGVAHMLLRWNPDEKRLPNGIPSRYTQVIEGAPVYDPRRDSTVPGGFGPHRINDRDTWEYATLDGNGQPIGRNNALQALWYLLGWVIPTKDNAGNVTGEQLVAGRGVFPEDINLATFIAGANACEVAGYYTDLVLSTEDDHTSNEDKITCEGLIGRLIDPGGLWSYYANVDDTANIAAELTDADVIQGATVNWNEFKGMSDQYNQVAGKFVNPSPVTLFQAYPYPVVRDAVYEANLGVKRRKTQDFEQVLDTNLAQRLARLLLNQGQYQGEHSANWNYKAGKAQAWSVVRYTSERFGWTKLFRVWRHDISTDGGVGMLLREIHPSIWGAGTVTFPEAPSKGIKYDPRQAIPATGVAISLATVTGTDGSIADAFNVVWDAPPENVRRTEIRYRVQGTTYWETVAPVNRGTAVGATLAPLLKGTVYQVQVRHVSIHEIEGPWVDALLSSGSSGNVNYSGIAQAGITAQWPYVGDPMGTRPENNATVGAPVNTNVAGVPSQTLVGNVSGNAAAIANQGLQLSQILADIGDLEDIYGNTQSAEASAAAAAASLAQSLTAQTLAEQAKTQSEAARNDAQAANSAAQSAQALASGSASTASQASLDAQSAQSAAVQARNEASGFASNAHGWADAASGSASSASASAGLSGQRADAANASAVAADTSRTQAQAAQSAAAASESNAAGAAASAAQQFNLTVSARKQAQTHAGGNIAAQGTFEDGVSIWNVNNVVADSVGGGFSKVLGVYNIRDALLTNGGDGLIYGNWKSRKIRVSVRLSVEHSDYNAAAGLNCYLGGSNHAWPGITGAVARTPGYIDYSGVIETDPNTVAIRPWVGSAWLPGDPGVSDFRFTNYRLEDVTESIAAANSASASAASASQASASQTEALNQAQASQTARIAAEAAKDAAQGSASAASGSASQANASATLAGQKADAANASAVQADTSRAQAQAAQSSAAASESNAAGSAASAAEQRNLAAQAYGNANDAAILSAGFRDQSAGYASAANNSASSAAASQSDAAQKASAAESSRQAAETAKGQAEAARDSSATSASNAAGSSSSAATQASLSATARNAAQAAAGRKFVGNFADEMTYWEWASGTPSYVAFGPGFGYQEPDKTVYFSTPASGYTVIRSKYAVPSSVGRRWVVDVPAGVYSTQINKPNSFTYYRVVAESGKVYAYYNNNIVIGNPQYWGDNYNRNPTLEFITLDGSALRVEIVIHANDGVDLFNAIHDIAFYDITEAKSAELSASASATSASNAAASQSAAGQSASAAEAAKVAAQTAQGGAEAARNQAATSQSNAAGSASAAAASQTLTAQASQMAQAFASGNLCPQPDAESGVNIAWPNCDIIGEGVGAGYTKVFRSTNRDAYAYPGTRREWGGRMVRVSARITGNYATCYVYIGVRSLSSAEVNNWYNAGGPPLSGGGWYDISGVVTIAPDSKIIFPWVVNQAVDGDGYIKDARWTAFRVEDVTEQMLAGAQASAAATSASQAAAAQTAAGQSANASEQSKVAAQTAKGQAEAAQSAAATSASGAAGSAAAAQSSATLSAKYGAGANNLLLDTDFSSGQAYNWAGYKEGAIGAQLTHKVGSNPFWSANIKGLEMEQVGEAQGFASWFCTPVQVIPGRYYIASFYLACHRCKTACALIFLDNDGNQINGAYNSEGFVEWGGGSTGLGAMLRVWAKAQAPANARFARLEVQRQGTNPGQGGSWTWAIYPQLSEVPALADGPPPFAHGINSGGMASAMASVTSNSAVIATLQGRALAYWQNTTNAGAVGTFIEARSESTYGAGATSAVSIGAREIHLYNQAATGLYSRALSVTGGRVTVFGDLDVGGAMRFGTRRIPVALQSFTLTANDGQAVTFGGDLTNIPKVEPVVTGLPALPSGQSYDVKALSLTSTGFTARQKIVTQGTPSNQNSGAGVQTGASPIWKAHKPSAGDAVDGIYNYFVSGQVQMYVYSQHQQQLQYDDGGNTSNIYVDCYVKRNGAWQAIGSLYTSVSSYGQYGSGMQTFYWDASAGIYCGDAIGQDGGGDYEFGIDVYCDQGNISSVSFGGVTYQAQGTQTAESAIPQAITYRIIPQNG